MSYMIKIKAKKLSSWKEKSEGLLSAKRATPIFFKTRFGIHTFFMKFPIDIVILGESGRVIACKEKLTPNKLYLWNPIYNVVLELPQGDIKRLKIKKGSLIKLV